MTEEITAQQETPVPAEPEDWRTKYKDDLAKEYVPVSQYKGIQRELNKARQAPKFDVTEIEERIVSRLAPVFDHLATRDSEDEEPKRRPLPSEMLKRAEQPKKAPDVDPAFELAARQVASIAKGMGIEYGTQAWNDLIHDSDGEERKPEEVLIDLNQRIIAQKVKEGLEAAKVEAAQKAKASGATRPDGAPSASSSRAYTREQISNMSYTEYKANEKDIDAAYREGRIT